MCLSVVKISNSALSKIDDEKIIIKRIPASLLVIKIVRGSFEDVFLQGSQNPQLITVH